MRYNAAQKITSNDSLWSHDDHKTGVSLHTPGPRGDLPKGKVSCVIRNKFTEDTKPNLSSKLKIQQGKWLWRSWQGGCLQYERTRVRIQSSATFIEHLVTVSCL